LTEAVAIKDSVNGKEVPANEYVVVSKTGKVKKNGTVTIDGVKYTIGGGDRPYQVTDTKVIKIGLPY